MKNKIFAKDLTNFFYVVDNVRENYIYFLQHVLLLRIQTYTIFEYKFHFQWR